MYKWLAGLLIFLPGLVMASQGHECLIAPSKVVKVSSPVPGVLASVRVKLGDRVRKGQVIATLKSGVERAAVALAKAKTAFNERKVERNRELYRKNLLSIHEKDEMETEALLARLELRQAQARLAQRTIRSPVSGIVTEKLLSAGEYVSNAPILTISAIDPLHIDVILPVQFLGKVRKGMIGEVSIRYPKPQTIRARVMIVEQVVDAASGTFRVRLEVRNPRHRIPAGIKCRVRFVGN